MCGCWSVSDARPIEKRAKPVVTGADAEQSIHIALTESTPTRTQVLLDRGANIEARNARGATPLITAAARGNLTLVLLLLNQGAEVDARDREGNTALHEASLQSHLPCVEALLTAGGQTSIRNGVGFTPLHQAVRRFWETAGESRADRLARQATVIHRLLRSGADPQMQDSGGRTPVVLAMESDNAPLQQAFSAPLVHATPTAVSPPHPQAPAEGSLDTGQAIVTTPADIDSGPRRNPSEVTTPPSPLDQPKEAPALLSGQPPAPPSNPAAATPDATDGNSRETSAPTGSAPAHPTLTAPASPDTQPIPTPKPPATAPPLPPNPEPHIPAPAPQAAVRQDSGTSRATMQASVQPSISPLIQTAPPFDSDSARPIPPPSPAATEDSPRTIVPTHLPPDHRESGTEQTAREPAVPPTTVAQAPSPVETGPRSPTIPPTPPSPSAGENAWPMVRREEQTSPAIVYSRPEEPTAKASPAPWLFQNVGFGLGLGWTHNLGPRRVESVSVASNRIVRIDDERNDLVRVMPEVHLWIDRWDEQRWSWGPFLAVAPGSRIINAVGGGLMVGYRPHQHDRYSVNFGIGGTLDLDTRVLGDGIIANEPLPPRETSARTKQTTGAGLLVFFSVGWDLSAPRQAQPPERK
ncbi:MAG: ANKREPREGION domain-containing protein [Nitrospira sp.]|nr:MAG: ANKREPREGION domain-containing protein [Nitrospira sp.]